MEENWIDEEKRKDFTIKVGDIQWNWAHSENLQPGPPQRVGVDALSATCHSDVCKGATTWRSTPGDALGQMKTHTSGFSIQCPRCNVLEKRHYKPMMELEDERRTKGTKP